VGEEFVTQRDGEGVLHHLAQGVGQNVTDFVALGVNKDGGRANAVAEGVVEVIVYASGNSLAACALRGIGVVVFGGLAAEMGDEVKGGDYRSGPIYPNPTYAPGVLSIKYPRDKSLKIYPFFVLCYKSQNIKLDKRLIDDLSHICHK
jgi:hypothetical protein